MEWSILINKYVFAEIAIKQGFFHMLTFVVYDSRYNGVIDT